MQISNQHYNIIFFLLCILSLAIDFIYLRIGVDLNGVSFFMGIWPVLADSTLLALPFIFLKGKKRLWILAILPIVSILVIANVIYFRNFSDLIGGVTYLSNVFDSRVLEGGIASFRILDLLPLLGMLIPFLWIACFHPGKINDTNNGDRTSCIFKKSILCICIISWIISLAGSTRRYAIYRNRTTMSEAIQEMLHFDGGWIDRYNAFNFFGYGLNCIYRIASSSRSSLTDEELNQIRSHLSSKHEKADSIFMDASKQNLMIIVVESLQSNVLQLQDSDKILPTLDSLAKNPATLFVGDCQYIAGPGRSSDAQFVINTGLLPLRDEAFISNYGDGDYPSLAKAFHGKTKEIIGENERCWFHYQTTKSYGFDSFVSNIADRCMDQDKVIFQRALTEIPKMHEPFYLFLSTLSMHDPFVEEKVSDHSVDKYLNDFTDDRDKEYLRRVSFFDKQLGAFINQLKKMNLYDDTLIVIVGDHEVNKNTVSKKLWDDSVPLLILDEGKREYRKKDVSQMDIFPTIISLLGLDYKYERFGVKYSGLGNSLFDVSKSAIPTEKDYEISDLIITRK